MPLASGAQLDEIVAGLGAALTASHADGMVMVGVLKGCVCFMADLARTITVPVEMDFLAVTPYTPGTGRVQLVKDLDTDIAGRHVVLVEDLVDTGLTLQYLRRELSLREPASLVVVALADKPARRIVPVQLDHVGLEVPDLFVLGYGLDFGGRYRNLHGLWGADAAALAQEPDRHLLELYED